MRRATLIGVLALLALARTAAAQAPGLESPPAPWFVVADIPGNNAKIASTRWLWNREARALRYCREAADTGVYSCAPDVILPEGRWVLDKLADQPSPGVASSARFYSPDRDQTLNCQAGDDGALACE